MLENRCAPSRTSRARAAVVALAVVAAVAPASARAGNKIFAAGSLIIPLQVEYQTDDGAIAAYGLVYSLLRHSADATLPSGCVKPITIYWSIAPNKLSHHRCNTNTTALPSYASYNDNDGCDFAVQSADGVPVAELTSANAENTPLLVSMSAYTTAGGPARGTPVSVSPSSPKKTVMKYLGGPWIIDATDRQCFLSMLSAYPELAQYHANGPNFSLNLGGGRVVQPYVAIHSARASFTAPIARILNQKPLLVALGGEQAFRDFLLNVMENAGLSSIPGWPAGMLDSQTTSVFLDSTPENPLGLLNNGKYGLFWGASGKLAGMSVTSAERDNLNYFVDLGNGLYAEAWSIDVLENDSTHAPLMTNPPGTDAFRPDIPYSPDCNDRKPGVSFFRAIGGGSCFNYGSISHPWTQAGNWPFQGGQADYKGFKALMGFQPGAMVGSAYGAINISAARYKDNDQTRGLVIYLAGMRFDNARYWGQRMIMNSVLANVPLILGVELARSEPVGYRDTAYTPARDHVYQGTYYQLPDPPEAYYRNYSTDFPQRWRFPYTVGHLYEYDIGDIPSGSSSFACSTTSTGACPTPNFDAADKIPLPKARTIWTYLAGSANLGWKRVDFDYRQTRAGCLDADNDGKCDLSQVLAVCNTAGVLSEDLLPYSDGDPTQRDRLGMFVQQVRGHCSAHNPKVTGTPIMEPADAECDDHIKQKNLAKLGGIDHGSPTIVGPSPYISDARWKNRPVVAYAGARDGMLHAFYVSGGGGWSDPSGKGLPAGVTAGQELWALVPPVQLCNLATNNAMVDAAMNVIDVFADFPHDVNGDGVIDWTNPNERPNHVREWRTVLLAAAGEGGSEVFALDVTNPVNPILLWHLSGTTEHDGRYDVNGDGYFDVFDKSKPATYALKWFDWDDGDTTTPHIPTDYAEARPAVLDELKTGPYDYRNLGTTYGTAIGKIASGDAYQYVAYVATTMVDYTLESPLGLRGDELFAIDLVTGKKLWQWERAYTRRNGDGTPIADNTIPGRMALVDSDADGSLDRVYLGDLEGHLWELSARNGRNLNYLPVKGTSPQAFFSFPLFGTIEMTAPTATPEIKKLFQVNGSTTLAQQPLTSPIGLGRFNLVRTELEPYLKGRIAVVQGAMGVDWSIAPFEPGSVYVIPVAPDAGTRVDSPVDVSASRDPRLYGVLKPEAAWRVPLRVGERVFGMPRVVNSEIIYNTAFGSFSGDITETITEAGNLYRVGATASGGALQTVTPNLSKSFGGVLLFGDKLVITTDNAISTSTVPPELSTSGPHNAANQLFNHTTPGVFKTWEPGEIEHR